MVRVHVRAMTRPRAKVNLRFSVRRLGLILGLTLGVVAGYG
jgi:hypothetical protein